MLASTFMDLTLKSGATFLARWSGANAQLWELTDSGESVSILCGSVEFAENVKAP